MRQLNDPISWKTRDKGRNERRGGEREREWWGGVGGRNIYIYIYIYIKIYIFFRPT